MTDGDESLGESKLRKQYLARLGIPEQPGEATQGSPAGRQLRPPPSVTLILLDWDDTLFCTTAVRGYARCPKNDPELVRLETVCRDFIDTCCSLGETIIVTNAQRGWVQMCVERFMPRLQAPLAQVRVLSARDRFEHSFPGDPVAWKCATFAELKDNSRQIANLVAIGDQEPEMEAVAKLARLYHTAFVKSIRFVEKPTMHQLRVELQLVAQKLPRITNAARHMSISLQQKVCAAP